MAKVSETGWPYIQHRGGPAGFLRVMDDRTLAFPDFRGNRQYISVGNLAADDRAALILVGYEWHDDAGQWFRSYGSEMWEFDEHGLMRQRIASINDLPIRESDRKYHWTPGRRPDGQPTAQRHEKVRMWPPPGPPGNCYSSERGRYQVKQDEYLEVLQANKDKLIERGWRPAPPIYGAV